MNPIKFVSKTRSYNNNNHNKAQISILRDIRKEIDKICKLKLATEKYTVKP